MKFIKKNCKILRYILLLVISIIPTLFTSASFYRINMNTSIEGVAKTLEILGRRQLVSVIDWINEFLYDLNALAQLSAFQNLNINELSKIIEYMKFNKPAYREIYVINSKNEILYGYAANKKEFLNSFVIKNALSGVEKMSEVTKVNNKLYIDIAVPIFSEDNSIGAICARIDLEYLNDLMKSIEKDETIESFIVDKNGLFLTDSRYLPDAVGNLKIDLQRVKTSIDFSKTLPYKDYRGIDVYGCYFNVNDTGWTLIVQKDADSVKKQNQTIIDIGKYTSLFQLLGLLALRKLKEDNTIPKEMADLIEDNIKKEKKS
ncbi:cache domain-containing protein [Caloramator sp. CAR-1]|uniref:cache domain-containing protein n=1 Tax=Caloramator sp. CAR-1 TaxID=3062777 RepID=UPI0026E1B4C9|nr:cache domain-containing protein [Caloramator sp. CAR-1]MDO6355867.1 cache domain-containing protein [Caloramator sp. CAR-1]